MNYIVLRLIVIVISSAKRKSYVDRLERGDRKKAQGINIYIRKYPFSTKESSNEEKEDKDIRHKTR